MLQTITGRDNERVKHARKLAASAPLRQEEGLFFAEGIKLCLDLAQSCPPKTVFATEVALAQWTAAGIACDDVVLVNDSVAQKLADTKTPQGLVCLFPLPAATLAQMDAVRGVLLCDRVQDPANVGALLRSAAGLGFGGAVLGEGCADAFGPKALRAGMGSALRLPVVRVASVAAAALSLKENGVTVVAAALEGAVPLAEFRAKPPFALMVGNEGGGLSAEALAACDEAVYIPMKNGVESLNVATAASVLMFALGGS